MTTIVALVGSLRTGSVNAAVARAAAENMPEGATLVEHRLHDLPMYNGDDEDAGLPAAVTALYEAIAAADGFIFFSPEYNGSWPAVAKNALDWLSRPTRPHEGKAVTMVVASPGRGAGGSLREHFEKYLPFQPSRMFPETLGIGRYPDKMTDGELTDPDAITELAAFLVRFCDFAASPPADDEGQPV